MYPSKLFLSSAVFFLSSSFLSSVSSLCLASVIDSADKDIAGPVVLSVICN